MMRGCVRLWRGDVERGGGEGEGRGWLVVSTNVPPAASPP